jgi:glycosyltransferase involved in cell wall biosynthesis
MKVALVHDYLNQFGGAERVLLSLSELFPEAPIFTLLYDEKTMGKYFIGKKIITSFLQRIPFANHYHRFLPWLMPIAVEQFDVRNFDVVISNSASFAKGVITKPTTLHIDYCSTPTRFLWDDSSRYVNDAISSRFLRRFIEPFLTYLRIWDYQASSRVDSFVANSHFVAQRIQKYYQRASHVIHPPVNAESFFIAKDPEDYFLMVGRLVKYKKFDFAIEVFNAIEKPLKIVGTGPELRRLKRIAKSNIEFLEFVDEDRLAHLYANAQALIFPQEEDAGIVPLESMASGRPVIAYASGGALETVEEGKTGIFFHDHTEIALAVAVGQYYQIDWRPEDIRTHALQFDHGIFKKKILQVIKECFPQMR